MSTCPFEEPKPVPRRQIIGASAARRDIYALMSRSERPTIFARVNENIKFPSDANVVFPLRPDLADEMCLFSSLVQPIKRTEADDFLGKIGVTRIGLALVQIVNEYHRAFRPRRFCCYYSVIFPGDTERTVHAFDGVNAVIAGEEAARMINEILGCAATSAGVGPQHLATVMLKDIPQQIPSHLRSENAVLHDTVEGVAAVVPLSTARSYAVYAQ